MSVPVMSDGMRSGVNWIRLNCRPSVCAIVRTSSVLAVPGKPVIRQWPADKQRDHHLFQNLFLAHNDPPYLLHNAILHLLKPLNAASQFGRVQIGDCS